MIGEDGQNDVLCRATVMQLANQFKTNGFRHLDERKTGADQVGVLGGTDPPCEGVGSAAHAGVGIRRLDKVANFDEFFPGHLMTNARRNAVNGRIIPNAGVFLEGDLEVT